MNKIQQLEKWGDTHHPKYLDIIRIILGIFLAWRGIEFLMNMATINDLLNSRFSFGNFAIMLLGHYIVFAHLIGGILLTLGVFTRFGSLIQIPIMIGAIIFVHSQEIFNPYSGMFLSILVLLLLVYFMVAGNGPWAIKFFDKSEDTNKYI